MDKTILIAVILIWLSIIDDGKFVIGADVNICKYYLSFLLRSLVAIDLFIFRIRTYNEILFLSYHLVWVNDKGNQVPKNVINAVFKYIEDNPNMGINVPNKAMIDSGENDVYDAIESGNVLG